MTSLFGTCVEKSRLIGIKRRPRCQPILLYPLAQEVNKRKTSIFLFFAYVAGQVKAFAGLAGMIFLNHPGTFWPALPII